MAATAAAIRNDLPSTARQPGKLLIDNRFVDSVSGKTFETVDPSTENVLTSVAEGDKADIDLAVAAARRAFESGPWSKMSARERGRVLLRIADLIMKNRDELAQLESLDNGKPIGETSNVDIPQAAEVFAYYGGWADKVYGQTIPT